MTLENLDIRGTLQEPDPANPGQTVKVVYQKTAPGLGNISNGGAFDRQRRAHVIPTDPRTAAQIARRSKMADAVAAWHAASPENRSEHATAAAARNITLFNAFVSHYLRN